MTDDADATRSRAPELAETTSQAQVGDLFRQDLEQYRVQEQIGAGGMGVVLSAKAERLGRTVALKMVTAERDEVRARFDREVRITARLQHPTIVPVYGAGQRDNQPFYVMKHVTGAPLHEVIAKTATLAERLALLPTVIAVSEAIAYAHTERIVHRDLKPANIIVGAFGETVIIDWGLAKDLDDTEEVADESPFRGSSDATQAGRVMGTPAYMPLEQARGEAVDERADVYAIGAILYHLLSGRPPYRRLGEDSIPWESALARVLAGAPPALAAEVVDAPADLLAIVDRAMARRAEDRYPSASELAADLRRFQTGQLVGAHRYSSWQLVRRWVRRHRNAVAVAAAALLVLVIGGGYSVTRIIDERNTADDRRRDAELAKAEADTQRVEAEQRRAESETRRVAAQKLIDGMLVGLREKLEPVGKLALLSDLATDVDGYYQTVSSDVAKDDPHDLLNRARALVLLGDVARDDGRTEQAERSFTAARGIAAAVHQRMPGDIDAEHDAAMAGVRLAILAADGDRADEIDKELDRAQPVVERLVQAHPERTAWVRDLSMTIRTRRSAAVIREQSDKARELAQKRVEVLEAFVATHPDDNLALDDLANAYRYRGGAMVLQNDLPAGEVDLKKAIGIEQGLAARHPENAQRLEAIAGYHADLARAYGQFSKFDESRKELDEAVATWQQLVARDPDNVRWLVQIPTLHISTNLIEQYANHDDLAVRAGQQAASELDALHDRFPKHPKVLEMRQIAYLSICEPMSKMPARTAEALVACEKLRAAAIERETGAALAHTLSSVDRNIAFVRWNQKDLEGAAKAFADSTQEARAALAADPHNEQLAVVLATALKYEAKLSSNRRMAKPTQDALSEAYGIYKGWKGTLTPEHRQSFADLCLTLATVYANDANREEAAKYAQEAVDLLTALQTAGQLPPSNAHLIDDARAFLPKR